jgi:hypothetical protein
MEHSLRELAQRFRAKLVSNSVEAGLGKCKCQRLRRQHERLWRKSAEDNAMSVESDAALPPPTLPANLPLSLMDFPDNPEWTSEFTEAVSGALVELSRTFPLQKLVGVTIGFDFGVALESVELGYESTVAKQYTNNADLSAVAKSLNVLRNGQPMAHVVYDGRVLSALMDAEHAKNGVAINLFVHELGHVVELKWRDDAMPGILLRYRSPSFVASMLLEIATTCWEEYAASRMAACYGDGTEVLSMYAANFNTSVRKALHETQSKIKDYREHASVERLLREAAEPLGMPLKLAGYLLGHLDGLEGEQPNLEDLCPDFKGTLYEPLLPQIRTSLRKLWDTKADWESPSIFDDLVSLSKICFAAAGIEIKQQSGSSHYINVPFSAKTMPNGEADMAMEQLRALFRIMVGH